MEKVIRFFLLFFIGMVAAGVDGVTSSGFGLVSSSLLLTLGFTSAIVSATVHFAELATTLISGISHWSFGNIHTHLFVPLTLSGIVGGLLGVFIVVNHESSRWLKLFIGVMLLILGILMILVFRNGKVFRNRLTKKIGYYIGFPAALIDAMVGGGWGPLTTPTMMLHGSKARHAIGTSSASEFFVTLAISIGFYFMLPSIEWELIIPMVIGAIITAPFAAMLTKKLPHKTLGVAVGIMIVIISIRNLIQGIF